MIKAVIIDYGVGNLFSLKHSLKKVGFDVYITDTPEKIKDTDTIVMPGVGNFRKASEEIDHFKSILLKSLKEGIILLGICLGMQLLFEKSEESPGDGLSILKGDVLKFPDHVKTPHMGWNSLDPQKWNPLLDGIDEEAYFYFVHSYYTQPTNQDNIVAKTRYGLDFSSIVAINNIIGIQFHPEKSGLEGERILQNFLNIMKR